MCTLNQDSSVYTFVSRPLLMFTPQCDVVSAVQDTLRTSVPSKMEIHPFCRAQLPLSRFFNCEYKVQSSKVPLLAMNVDRKLVSAMISTL